MAYEIEDEIRRNCPHDAGTWLVEGMYICPMCGDLIATEAEIHPTITSSSNDTVYLLPSQTSK